MASGQPLPEEQAEPFAQRPRPDPEIAAPIDLDLGHAFHARPEHRLTPARKFGLDPEQVLSIDVGRYRRDPPDGERHRVDGKASRSETALLAGTQIVSVLFLAVRSDELRDGDEVVS